MALVPDKKIVKKIIKKFTIGYKKQKETETNNEMLGRFREVVQDSFHRPF